MGSGLSMASVNKIKELANQREYSLALDIIDSQDLSKSLNPQFLRLCGEIFIKSKRYVDARKSLVMAHKIAPEAKRIIFDLIDLYTKMGYKELAEKYYNIYMYDADEESLDTKQTKYLFDKYNNKPLEEIKNYIIPYYVDNMDYDWSFEAYLLLKILDDEDDEKLLKSLVDEYSATFKNSDNCKIIDSVNDDKMIAESKFYNFSKDVLADDEVAQKEIRRDEAKQLVADEERVNPNAAEIIEIIDEEEKQSKGFFKKKRGNPDSDESQPEENTSDEDVSSDKSVSDSSEVNSEEDNAEAGEEPDKAKFTSFFKKMFSKKKSDKSDDSSGDDTVNSEDTESDSEKKTSESKEKQEEPNKLVETDKEAGTKEDAETTEEANGNNTEVFVETEEADAEVVDSEETAEAKENEEADADDVEVKEDEETKTEEFVEVVSDDNEYQNTDIDNKDIGVKNFIMHGSEKSLNDDEFSDDEFDEFSEEEFDDFEAESDTIDDLIKKENEYNTSDEDNGAVEEPEKSVEESDEKESHGVLFEEVDISFDDEDDEFEVDDFTVKHSDEFGEIPESELEEVIEEIEEESDSNDIYDSEEVYEGEVEFEAAEETVEEEVEFEAAEEKVEETVEEEGEFEAAE